MNGKQNIVVKNTVDDTVDVEQTTRRLFRYMFTSRAWLKNTGWIPTYFTYEESVFVDKLRFKVSFIVESFIARLLIGMKTDYDEGKSLKMKSVLRNEWDNCIRRNRL